MDLKIWQYLCITLDDDDPYYIEDRLNKYGKDGWELVHIDRMKCVFKTLTPSPVTNQLSN